MKSTTKNKTEKYNELEIKLGYVFKEKKHLDTAFTHKSFVNENQNYKNESYERYEFLGDAILEFIVSEFLFFNHNNLSEGGLTKLRASLVCEHTLSKIAMDLELGKYTKFSIGEKNSNTSSYRSSLLCDLFESLLGAIYLDGGLSSAKSYVDKFLLNDIEKKSLFYDSKTKIQEYIQKNNCDLVYELMCESGPEHSKEFTVAIKINNNVIAVAKSNSKKSAEQMAAYEAIKKLDIK